MKRLIAIAAAAAMLVSGFAVFAEEPAAPEGPQTVVMKVEDAVEYALGHSLALESVKSDIFGKRYSLTDAKRNYDNKRELDMEYSSFEEGLRASGYYVDMAQMQLDAAERSLLTEENKLRIQVQKDFYTYINAQHKVEFAQTNLDSAREKLEFAKVKKDSGSISELEYMEFETAVSSAQNALAKAQREVNLANLQVKFTLNFPQKDTLVLQGTFAAPTVQLKTPDEAVALSKTFIGYRTLQDSLTVAQKRWDKAMIWYVPIQVGYQIEQAAYQKAQADFQTNVQNMELGIRKQYNALLEIEESLVNMRENLALIGRNVEAMKLRYDMGMVAASDVIETEQKYFDLQNQIADLELSYWETAMEYRSNYTYEDDGTIQ